MYNEYIASVPLEIVGAIAFVPFVYFTVYIAYLVFCHVSILQRCQRFLRKYRTNAQLEPDRLVNPEEYRQLLPNANHEGDDSEDTSHNEINTHPACGNSLQDYGSV